MCIRALSNKQAKLLVSPRMVGMNIRMTACEATFESLLQLSLQSFIIFLKSASINSSGEHKENKIALLFADFHHPDLSVHGVCGCF